MTFHKTSFEGFLGVEIVVKQLKNRTWRAYWKETHKGTRVGRGAFEEAKYQMIRDHNENIIQAKTKKELLDKLKKQPFIREKDKDSSLEGLADLIMRKPK